MEARGLWDDIVSAVGKNVYRNPIPSKIVFKNEGKVNTFLGEQKLRQFLASRFSV